MGKAVLDCWDSLVIWPREADLCRWESVRDAAARLVKEESFDGVLHLAGQASQRKSYERTVETWEVNVQGTVHLTEALTDAGWSGRFLYVSSGAVYGDVTGDIDEDSPIQLCSPYVASKLAAEMVVLEWGKRTGVDAMIVRPFNHSGPGQSVHYFLPSMACQVASLPETGGVVEVGNLAVHKDFLHIKDVVSAYRALLAGGRAQEIYNLAGGKSAPLEEILQKLALKSGRKVEYKVTEDRFRDETTEELRVDLSKLQNDTGWVVQYGLDDLLEDLLQDWKDKKCRR